MQITVQELLNLCINEVKKGNGDKAIVISDDNEGNGFHGLFFGFSKASDFEEDIRDTSITDVKKLIVLG